MFMEVSLDFSSSQFKIHAFNIFYFNMFFFFWNHFKVAWVGSEQLEIVSSVTCVDSTILAASAHQTLGRGLGIDACCLRRCLYNPRISSSIRPPPQPLRLTNGKSFFINLCCVFPLTFKQLMSLAVFFPPSTEVSPTSCLPRWLFIWYWAQLRWQRHHVDPHHLSPPRCSWTSWRSCRRSETMRPNGGTTLLGVAAGAKTKDEFQGWILSWFVY